MEAQRDEHLRRHGQDVHADPLGRRPLPHRHRDRTRSGYTSKSATSARVGIPIYNTTRPSISGTLRAGSTIAVTNGSWTPTPSTYAYQWYRNGVAISGATSKTYVVRSIDRGQLVKAKVVARRTGYSSGSIYTYSKTIAR